MSPRTNAVPAGADRLPWPRVRSSLMVASTALAVDIGGTKLAAALVDETGAVGWRATVPTPATDSAESLFSVLADLIERSPARDAVVCGVGSGGPMTANGELVSPLNIPAWRDFPLRRRLATLTGLQTFVDNDAKALALGEGWRGGAVGLDDYLAMVVSTVTWRSSMASSNAACVFGDARLISSARTRLAKMPPGRKAKLAVCRL